MPSVTRQRRGVAERRAAVERQVLEAVERLLGEGESFTSLGIQRIAEEAGMARTTFYGHFRDKPTLLMRVTDNATQDLFADANAWVRDDASTREQLEQTVFDLIRGYREHQPLLRAVQEVAAYEPEVEGFWRATVEGFAEGVRRRLERDVKAGRIPDDLDTRTTAFWVAWGAERTVAQHVATRPPREDRRAAAGIAAATWAAMRRD